MLIIGCLFLYATSKYYPVQIELLRRWKMVVLFGSSSLILWAWYLFTKHYDTATAWMVWLIALITILACIILSIKMHPKATWFWGMISVLFILLDIH